MSRSDLSSDFDGIQTEGRAMSDDNESVLSDNLSLKDPMDVDLDPFPSEPIGLVGKPNPQPGGFSVQYLLPLEVVEMIAIRIADDADLLKFALTCKDFATAIVLEKSTVWRARFLDRYDHPLIEGPYEFRVAYQLREFVLKMFPSFAGKHAGRGRMALEVLRDMVLETYHNPHTPKSTYSRNLDSFSSPKSAPYMEEFLSSPFYAYGTAGYGRPNGLFAALQILFSHLVLHPRSDFAATVRASRENYDLNITYLHDVPLRTVWYPQESRLGDSELRRSSMKLDLEALLHIRNFWHAHLAYKASGMYANAALTYGRMARALVMQNHAPQKWDGAIQGLSDVLPHWFGHYSCTHPNPRKIQDIEEHQTCAEDWINQYGPEGVHPLSLDIASTTLPQRGWWPPIFATMPILESSTPVVDAGNGSVYIRGIAPFFSPLKHPDMYPAYKALRVRGIIHKIPKQKEIPGWRRIIMVLYQPTPRYLLAVLDENSPPDDDPFDQIEPIAALQAPNTGMGQLQDPGQTQNQAQMATTPPVAPSSEAVEKMLKEELESREELKGPVGPAYLTRDFIADMEDNLHPPEELAWDDFSYAYVYEGVIIPGGKIMMGRYWRCGPPTVMNGFEEGDGADRGPWVFWC